MKKGREKREIFARIILVRNDIKYNMEAIHVHIHIEKPVQIGSEEAARFRRVAAFMWVKSQEGGYRAILERVGRKTNSALILGELPDGNWLERKIPLDTEVRFCERC